MAQFCTRCGKENKDNAQFCSVCGERLENAAVAAAHTTTVLDNRYKIMGIIKSGAMGCVFKAKDTRLDNIVAVKQMLSSSTNPQDAHYAEMRFKEEAKMLSALKHNGLPKVIDYFTEKEPSDGKVLHYLVMEFVEGKDLETIIHERGQKPFPMKETLDILQQILDIFSYLHTQKPPIVYRDMNPRNVMISNGAVFLVDFGIAKVLTPQQKGTAIGTAGYAAPEQYRGNFDIQSDIYSLGAMMHYLLTGIDPEHGTTKLFTFQQIRTVNSSVPEYLELLVMSMVEVIPGKRPSDAGAVRDILDRGIQLAQHTVQGISSAEPSATPAPLPSTPKASPDTLLAPLAATKTSPVPTTEPSSVIKTIPVPPSASSVPHSFANRASHFGPSAPRLRSSLMIAATVSGLVIIFLLLAYFSSQKSTNAPVSTSEVTLKKVRVNTKDGAAMILIPAGEFLMGSPEGQGNDDEHPQHRVYLDAYYIYKYEVTNGQFIKFVKATGYSAEGDWKGYAKLGRERHPVVNISWNDAVAYCRWAGGKLPTEAQWEKAARGINGRVYPWGDTWDKKRCNWDKGPKVSGMFDICGGKGTSPVGSFPSGVSSYGVHDLAGNVWEWCSDCYSDIYYRNTSFRNPEGPGSGEFRIIRGGAWYYAKTSDFRCANRLRRSPECSGNYNGFRVCHSSTTP